MDRQIIIDDEWTIRGRAADDPHNSVCHEPCIVAGRGGYVKSIKLILKGYANENDWYCWSCQTAVPSEAVDKVRFLFNA